MNFMGALFLILGVAMVISGTRNAHFWLWLDGQWNFFWDNLNDWLRIKSHLTLEHPNGWLIGIGTVLTLLGLWIILYQSSTGNHIPFKI